MRLPILFLCLTAMARAANPPANTDESKVPPYTLPDPLVCVDGTRVTDPAMWKSKRRPELLRLFDSEIYGRTLLGRPETLRFEVREEKKLALAGLATRLRIGVLFEGTPAGRQMELLVYLPNDVPGPVPVFLGLNFDGNYTVVDEADLPVPRHFAMGLFANRLPDHVATEAGRGIHASLWQVDRIVEAGFGFATAAYGEIEPDENGAWQKGPRGLAAEPAEGDWGAIGAWAWGLSRAMDYLETNSRVDARKVAVTGFSRLGKAALWAAAQDERFALVVSTQSGAGGLALHRRQFGEAAVHLTRNFPHWFAKGFAKYAGAEDKLPVDSHELAALIAPRPLLGMSGTTDLWSDPKGEFLSLVGADPVYRLFDPKAGLKSPDWPETDKVSDGTLAYYRHEGGHDVSLEDWRVMISHAHHSLKVDPRPAFAADRYARRLAMLPEAERAAWTAYFNESDRLRRADISALDAELKAAQLSTPRPAPHAGKVFEVPSKAPDAQFSDEAARTLAKAIVSFQLPSGGWSKAVDYGKGPREAGMAFVSSENAWHYAGTFDNRSTTEQLRFLARVQSVAPDDIVKPAVEKGIDGILAAQAPNGGWPQNFPLEGGYHDFVTLNDDAMIHVLDLLQDIVGKTDGFAWIDEGRRARAKEAIARGHAALLRLQKGIWSPQYELLTGEIVGARGFELAGLSAGESVEVLRYLMALKAPDPAIVSAIEAGLEWFRTHELPPGDSGKPRWARFNHPRTGVAFFPGKRDGRAHASYEEMRKTNPGGYDYFTDKGADLLGKWSERWRKNLTKQP